ncbi:hypothetical protein AAG570_012557, partial [Ranatra chinensis]
TLTDYIQQWVLPGTTIYTDCWTAYNRLGELCYNHLTVNHSLNFVDPNTGTHTNTIEGMWRHVKHLIPGYSRTRTSFPNYLAHFLFDRLVKSHSQDIDLRFLHIVKLIDWSTLTVMRANTDNDLDNDTDDNRNDDTDDDRNDAADGETDNNA